jgi:cytochrome c1
VPNTRAWMESWIADPANIKPGTLMPGAPLSRADIAAIAAYLETLK